MGYRFAVCDDDRAYMQYVAGLVEGWASLSGVQAELELFPSAEAFLFRYEEQPNFDVLLLDIEMPGMDGVALAKALRRSNEDVQMIFITGYTDYIAEGYEVSALHYLTKPVSEEKLCQVLTRAVNRLARNEPVLTLELSGGIVRLPMSRIRWLEVLHNYVTIHADRDYQVKRPLNALEQELDTRFFRVGRSCIVNLTCIWQVSRTEILLSTGETIPLPRGQYDALNRAVIQRI